MQGVTVRNLLHRTKLTKGRVRANAILEGRRRYTSSSHIPSKASNDVSNPITAEASCASAATPSAGKYDLTVASRFASELVLSSLGRFAGWKWDDATKAGACTGLFEYFCTNASIASSSVTVRMGVGKMMGSLMWGGCREGEGERTEEVVDKYVGGFPPEMPYESWELMISKSSRDGTASGRARESRDPEVVALTKAGVDGVAEGLFCTSEEVRT